MQDNKTEFVPDHPVEVKKWRCTVCGYIYEGENPPETCPICGVPADMFELVEEEVVEAPMTKKWRCTVCGYIYEGDELPEVCPICGVPADMFELVEEAPAAAMDPEEKDRLQSLMFDCSYGLYVVTAREDEFVNGMVCNTFMQVTDSPLRASLCLNKGGKTCQMIKATKACCVNILGQDNHDLVTHFGGFSGHVVNKFETLDYVPAPVNGCPELDNTLATVALEIEKEIDLGTHTMFIGRIVGGTKHSDGTPMTYAYYRATRKK